jgi:hypothetical protein
MTADLTNAFRDTVLPALAPVCRAQGLFLTLEMVDFDGAWAAVMARACARGALHLSPERWDDLDDWVCARLLEAVDAFEPDVLAQWDNESRALERWGDNVRAWRRTCHE